MRTSLVLILTLACGSAFGGDKAEVAKAVALSEHATMDQVEVEPAPLATLDGMSFWNVTVLIPDHPGTRCARKGKETWCGDVLSNAVNRGGWGKDTQSLDDAQWAALIQWSLGGEPVSGPDGLRLLGDEVPAGVRKKVAGPSLARDGDRVVFTAMYEGVSMMAYPMGPKSLVQVEVRVGPDGVKRTDTELWSSN